MKNSHSCIEQPAPDSSKPTPKNMQLPRNPNGKKKKRKSFPQTLLTTRPAKLPLAKSRARVETTAGLARAPRRSYLPRHLPVSFLELFPPHLVCVYLPTFTLQRARDIACRRCIGQASRGVVKLLTRKPGSRARAGMIFPPKSLG